MGIFDGQLQGSPHLMRIERAVAGLIEPARVFADERLVADLLPVADAGGVADEIGVGTRFTIVSRPIARETHGRIGVAFTRAKAVAHGDNENVADLGLRAQLFAAADLDFQADAAGISDIESEGLIARLRNRFAAQRRAIALRRRQPRAGEIGRFVAKARHLR